MEGVQYKQMRPILPPPLRHSQYPGRIHRLVSERMEGEVSRGSWAFEVKRGSRACYCAAMCVLCVCMGMPVPVSSENKLVSRSQGFAAF